MLRAMAVKQGRWSARLAALAAAVVAAVIVAAPPSQAMAGGQRALPGEAPWMATLALKVDKPLPQRASCGGALVAPDKVLTAAHCVAGIPPDKLVEGAEYHIGARVLSREPGQVAGIASVAVHPDYRLLPSPEHPDDPSAASARNDAAVVTLDRPVAGVTPLAVADHEPGSPSISALYGHGITSPQGEVGDALRRGLYRPAPAERCAHLTPAVVDTASMLCGRPINAEACTGDSGGPLVTWRYGRPVAVGVFSFGMETAGRPCGNAGPNFFTSTAAVHPWLEQQLPTSPA